MPPLLTKKGAPAKFFEVAAANVAFAAVAVTAVAAVAELPPLQ